MGVRGLLEYLRRNPNSRIRKQSLIRMAEIKKSERKHVATIVCDFFSVLLWLLKLFHEAKVKEGSYSIESYLFGGDYVDYSKRFIEFLKALKNCGVEPILFVDGSRGSSLEDLNAKFLTLRLRDRNSLHSIEKCVEYCKYDGKLDLKGVRKCRKYPLVILHILMAVQRELPDVKIVHCDSEADSEMAVYAREHSEVCGILSTDTDMVMMRKCEIIHCKFFDREDILKLRMPNFNEKPDDIICEVITPKSLAKALKISIDDLKIVSIICGNDYTKFYEIHQLLKLKYPFIKHAAEWINDNSRGLSSVSHCLFDLPSFKEILSNFPEFFHAVKHTYEAYGDPEAFTAMCKSTKTEPAFDSYVSSYLVPSQELSISPVVDMVCAGIKSGAISHRLSSIARCGIHWRHIYVEGQASKERIFFCMQDLMFLLRRIIYLLLGLKKVREYGNFSDSVSTHSVVCRNYLIASHSETSTLLKIREMQDTNKVLHLISFVVKAKFLRHFTHLECLSCATNLVDYRPHIESQLNPVLLCASLLHALSLTNTLDIEITKDIFLATCLMSTYGDPCPNVFERPTLYAMNMNTEFACIIHHAYEIASLFNLLGYLWPPGYCYKSAILVAFHQIAVATEARVKQKLKENPNFVSLHTTYTHILHSSTFKELKQVLDDFYQKCKDDHLEAMDLVCLARAFYQCLGQYHDTLPDLEEEIHELQARVITSKSSKMKGIIL